MEDIEIPHYFLCPISLQIMKDPVTVSTGITYDRESIEKWIYSNKNNSCPVTKQVICDPEFFLTPNHTLRRLIQAWCTINASNGVERIPTPKPPVDKTHIVKLLSNANSPGSQISCLRRLRVIASESETNKRCVESAGAVEFLASVVSSFVASSSLDESNFIACDEALSTLYNLNISDSKLNSLVGKNGEFIDSLTEVMKRGSYESRAYAVMFLKSTLEVMNPMTLVGLKTDLFVETIQILKDQISNQASKAALHILVQTCPWGRNRVKAVEVDGVSVLIELLLLDSSEKRICEMILTALDLLCGCADGRAAMLSHGAGIAIVGKKIMRVSQLGNERAVRILNSIARFSGNPMVLQEMLQLGIVAKLCLLLQVDGGNKAKEKAREILKLHARVWKNSPCIPRNFDSFFPKI